MNWETVWLKLQEIFDSEDKANPLSDHAIVEVLSSDGVTVACRTVTKYRQRMNIPNWRGRRDSTKGEK